MKFQLLCLLYLFATVHCAVLPRDDKIGYNRRPNADEVRGKLITYWSQPPIFAQLPDEQKPQIEAYCRKYGSFPNHDWKRERPGVAGWWYRVKDDLWEGLQQLAEELEQERIEAEFEKETKRREKDKDIT